MQNGTYTIQCACGADYAALIERLFRLDEAAGRAKRLGWRVSTVCGEHRGRRWRVRSTGLCPSCAAGAEAAA